MKHISLSLRTIITASVTLAVGFLIFTPLFMLFLGSFRSAPPGRPGNFTLQNYQVLTLPWYGSTLLNTLSIACGGAAIATILGVPLGWLVSRTNVPLAKVWDRLAVTPIFISPFIGGTAWILLASPDIGIINNFTRQFSLPTLNVYSYWGMIWVAGLFFSPYVFLFVSGALRSMDSSLEESARMCGTGVFGTAVRITLPLIAPAILSAMLLVFVLCAEQFSIPALLGWPVEIFVMSVRIFSFLAFPPVNYGAATVLCIGLLAITGTAMYAYRRVLAGRQFVTVTGKGFRPSTVNLGRWKFAALFFCVLYFLVAVAAPLSVIVITSFLKWTGDYSSLSFANYENIFRYRLFYLSYQNSLFIAFVGATAVMGMSAVISWIVHRTRTRGRGLLDYISIIPTAIPGMVLGVGILWAWISIPVAIYGTIWILIIACMTRFLSYGVRSTSSTLVQIHKDLEESSTMCGASWLRTFSKITLPLLKPGIVSGWLLLFIVFFRELEMVLLLWTSNTITLSVFLFDLWTEGNFPRLCTLGVVQTLTILLVFIVMKKLLGAELKPIY